MLYTAITFKLVFDHQPDDVYWCTADIGWITGHSYITYGPLANGATSVLVSHRCACICIQISLLLKRSTTLPPKFLIVYRVTLLLV